MYRIYYGDGDAFAGVSPLPFIERTRTSIDLSEKQGWLEQFVLRGRIIGKCIGQGASLEDMWERKDRLLTNFQSQFQNFYITKTGEIPLYSGSKAYVRDITFEDSNWATNVFYTITLDVMTEENFSGLYGVTSPSDSVTFSNRENGQIRVRRQISAEGIHTPNRSPYENAKSYVEGISGKENIVIAPAFITGLATGDMFLDSESISLDRLGGSYSIEQEWIYDTENQGAYNNVLLRTTSEIASGESEVTVSVQGEINGGMDASINDLRTAYSGVDMHGVATGALNSIYGQTGLYERPITRSVNENVTEKTINFSSSFSDRFMGDVSVIDTFTVSRDFAASKYCANASVTIRGNYGTPAERWTDVQNYYTGFDIQDFIFEKWTEYGYDSSGTLTSGLKSFSLTEDSGNSTLRVGGGLCQNGTEPPTGFSQFSFSVNINPARSIYVEHAGLEQYGDRVIQKTDGRTRSIYSIQGSATKGECQDWTTAETNLKSKINELFSEYTDGMGTSDHVLTNFTMETGLRDSKNSVSFSASWSLHGGAIF